MDRSNVHAPREPDGKHTRRKLPHRDGERIRYPVRYVVGRRPCSLPSHKVVACVSKSLWGGDIPGNKKSSPPLAEPGPYPCSTICYPARTSTAPARGPTPPGARTRISSLQWTTSCLRNPILLSRSGELSTRRTGGKRGSGHKNRAREASYRQDSLYNEFNGGNIFRVVIAWHWQGHAGETPVKMGARVRERLTVQRRAVSGSLVGVAVRDARSR